jgi:hypothetical protein
MLAIRGILSYETIDTLVIPLVAQRLSRRNNLLPTDPMGQLRVPVLEPIVFFLQFAQAAELSSRWRQTSLTLLVLC